MTELSVNEMESLDLKVKKVSLVINEYVLNKLQRNIVILVDKFSKEKVLKQ